MSDADDILNTSTATQTQLAKLFQRNKSDMPRLLSGIAPVGTRRTYDVYSIVEAAPALLKPSDPAALERALLRMNKADMPPQVGNDFWAAQRSRRKYELENGDLWPTADVEALVTAIFHVIAMQMKLMEDTVERQSGLTDENRTSVRRIAEGVVNGIREEIGERLANWAEPQDNVMDEETE